MHFRQNYDFCDYNDGQVGTVCITHFCLLNFAFQLISFQLPTTAFRLKKNEHENEIEHEWVLLLAIGLASKHLPLPPARAQVKESGYKQANPIEPFAHPTNGER
jgi:hypothetical protein